MSESDGKCAGCAVPIWRGRQYPHGGHVWHTPCLVRHLQGSLDAITERYELLRPHVSDRSVLRGLCRLAEAGLDHPALSSDLKANEDCQNAMVWLSQAAGWSWP